MNWNSSTREAEPRRIPGHLGLWLALAFWALLVVAGTAAALAADEPTAASGSSTMIAAVQGTGDMPATGTAKPVASGTPSGSSTSLAPGQAAPGTTDQPASAQAGAPDDAQDLESVLGAEPPTRVRVAILDATGKPGGANKVAVLLGEYKRQVLEDQIGMQIEVVNLSTADGVRPGRSVLFYRPDFLRAALVMAKAIPGDQVVEPMRPAGLKRAGVDVEIVVGQEVP